MKERVSFLEVVIFFKVLFLCFPLVTGCSTIHYRSSGKIPVHFTGKLGHFDEVKLSGSKDFFLWGLIPEKRTVYLDQEAREQGFAEFSRPTIREFSTWKDILFLTISLGLYTPRSYEVSGYGRRI